jgi:hypothetical protein
MLFNGLTKSRAIKVKRNSPSHHSNTVVPCESPNSSLFGESPSTISSAPTPMALSLPTPTSQPLPMSNDDMPLDNAPSSSSQLSHFSTTIKATPSATALTTPSSLNNSLATLFFNAQQSRHHTSDSSHPPTPTSSVTPTATRSYDDGGSGDSNLETIQLAPPSPASTGSIFSSKLPISSPSSSFAGSNTPTPPTRLSLGKLMDFPTNLLHIPTKMQDVTATMWARHKRYSSGGRESVVSYVIMCLKIICLCVLCIIYRANTARLH